MKRMRYQDERRFRAKLVKHKQDNKMNGRDLNEKEFRYEMHSSGSDSKKKLNK